MTPGSITIVMDMPPSAVGPNGNSTWQMKARLVSQIRTEAGWHIREQQMNHGITAPWPAATMHIRWVSVGRLPDDDNAIGRCKAIRDGAMDAGLVLDDATIRVGTVTIERGKPVRVEITFEEAQP